MKSAGRKIAALSLILCGSLPVLSEVPGKQLKNRFMSVIDQGFVDDLKMHTSGSKAFSEKPFMVSVDQLRKNARKMLIFIEAHAKNQGSIKEEQLFAQAIVHIVNPVKGFLGYLHQFQKMLCPLLRESLGDKEFDSSIIKQFFSVSESEADVFFGKILGGNESVSAKMARLTKLCKEFVTIGDDLMFNLSKDTKLAYATYLKEQKGGDKKDESAPEA